ncbi:methylmalonyl Co-A mutase-associated GTPase MeaB [Mucilaginibacter myungsuensis]
MVENDLPGAMQLLANADLSRNTPIIGITGPPGAGKSTLVNALIAELTTGSKKVAVLAVDPTSPFNHGSLLGDRIRMAAHFNNPNVFIRSIATRGSLGGLSARTIEMTDVLRAEGFDHIIVETVGVGQSEIEIAGLADITLLVLVPESGDEIQNIKSGIMEIADAFIINKADRDGADTYYNTLQKLLAQSGKPMPIYKAIASQNKGMAEIAEFVSLQTHHPNPKRAMLLAEKAWQIIRDRRMANIDKKKLQQDIAEALTRDGFNLYQFLLNAKVEISNSK